MIIFDTLVYNLILIMVMHWMSDFLLQTDKMAINKSTSVKWLSIHAGVYTLPWFLFGWQFALINGIAHWLIDFFTSKWSSYYMKKGQIGNQFNVIGLDQAIHMTILIGTYFWLFV